MARSRYDPPDPKCNHKRKGIVSAGSGDGAHASTSVCNRPDCIADAKQWAHAVTRLPAVHVVDQEKPPPSAPRLQQQMDLPVGDA